jgi:hypothetical protein
MQRRSLSQSIRVRSPVDSSALSPWARHVTAAASASPLGRAFVFRRVAAPLASSKKRFSKPDTARSAHSESQLATIGTCATCARRVQIGAHYDDTIPCSKALPANAQCNPRGGNVACGYGFACVAKNVRIARCLPICRAGYSGRRFSAGRLQKFYLGAVAAGCKEDSQKRDRSLAIKVGAVSVNKRGIATPDCVEAINIGSTANVGKPRPKPPGGKPGPHKPPVEAPDVARRKALARQVVGLGNVYYEGKRAGLEPRDSNLFPQARPL